MEIFKIYKKTHNNRTGIVVWEVSNYGNVKKNSELYECGINPVNGYKVFSRYSVHRAVAELFIENPDNKPEVDHIDTDKLNNNVSNLRWVTRKENLNNTITRQHNSEAVKKRFDDPEERRKISEATKKAMEDPEIRQKMRENSASAVKCIYNGIDFCCMKDAYDYAVKNCGYTKSYSAFKLIIRKEA